MNTVLAEKLSALVQYQLPDFVRDNYETFQAFLIAYYEFLEKDGEAQYVLQNSENYKDIDDTIDSFVDKFLKQYAYDLPESIFLNQETKELLSADTFDSKRAVAKHLRKYYASKGSESGVKLLFRLLFDDDISFYYPKEDIFKPSSGVWTKRQTLKLIDASSNSIPSGAIITGNSSGAFAIVDKTYLTEKRYSNVKAEILEVQFDRGSLQESFTKGERVTIQYGNVISGNLEVYASAKITNVVSTVSISDGGFGHTIDDIVTVSYDRELKPLATLQSPYSNDAYYYGISVSASNSYIAVGAPGVGIPPFVTKDGNVHVYSSTNYGLLYTKTSPETPNGGNFGQKVAISENYLVVSEPYISTSSNGGNVHIFYASNGTLISTVTGPAYAYMGESLALSGNLIAAGAPSMDYYTNGGNVFLISANTGSIIKTIQNPNYTGSPISDFFGRSVAISPSYLVVGSAGSYEEAVYLYSVPTGTYLRKILNPNLYGVNDDAFGSSVAITDSYIAVGAPYEKNAQGSVGSPGIVYVFDILGTLLTAIENPNYDPNGSSSNLFGRSLAIVDNILVVGQSQKYSANNEIQSGKIYMFEIPSGRLLDQYDNINDYGTPTQDWFGESVAISESRLVIAGAPYEDSQSVEQIGRAYVFGPEYLTQSSFRGLVSKVSGVGRVKEIAIENFGNDFTEYPIPTITGRITAPSVIYNGKYKVTSNIATVVLFDSTGNSFNHGLNLNDTVDVKFTSGMTGANGIATVTKIVSSRRFNLGKANVFYTSEGNISILPKTANISATIGVLCEYPGTYDTNRDGHVSDIKKLQDGDYYQENSYVIRATKSSYLWKDIIKKTLHPAGLKLFSEIYISTANSIVSVSVEPPNAVYTTIVYLLKLLSTSVVNTLETIQPTTTVTLESISRASRNTGDAYAIGPTFQTIDQFKYAYTNLHVYDLADYTLDFFANNINTPTLFAPPDEIYRGNANIILNSTFDDTSTWKLGSGLSITTGNLVGSAATASAWQPFTTAGNVKCMATYQIRRISAGSIALTTNTFSGTSRTTVGNYSEIFFASHPNGNIILSATGFTGDVDNVYVKVLEPITN